MGVKKRTDEPTDKAFLGVGYWVKCTMGDQCSSYFRYLFLMIKAWIDNDNDNSIICTTFQVYWSISTLFQVSASYLSHSFTPGTTTQGGNVASTNLSPIGENRVICKVTVQQILLCGSVFFCCISIFKSITVNRVPCAPLQTVSEYQCFISHVMD